MKSTGKAAARIAVFLAGWVLLAMLPLLFGGAGIFSGSGSAAAQLLRELAPLGAAVLLSVLFCRLDREWSGVSSLVGCRSGEGLLLGGGIGVLLAGGVLLLFRAGGLMSFRSQLHSLDGIWLWLLALLCRTAWMALLCCGYLFALLEKQFGPAGAVMGSVALYLLLCTKFWEAGLAAAANGLAIGLLLGLLRLVSGGTAAPAAAAFLWNFAAGFVFNGLPLDGYPHLTKVVFEGPVLLSGGESGMNGSLITLGMALLCCGILLAARLWTDRRAARGG